MKVHVAWDNKVKVLCAGSNAAHHGSPGMNSNTGRACPRRQHFERQEKAMPCGITAGACDSAQSLGYKVDLLCAGSNAAHHGSPGVSSNSGGAWGPQLPGTKPLQAGTAHSNPASAWGSSKDPHTPPCPALLCWCTKGSALSLSAMVMIWPPAATF